MSFIPIIKPDIGTPEIDLVSQVLFSGKLVHGKYAQLFEAELASFIGVNEALLVANGTATMHIMLTALGIGPNDEVIVPAFSYVATANVVEMVGAKPVFVDIDRRTFNINTKRIEEKITSKTKAILAVHEFGLTADVTGIRKVCDQYNLLFFEDAACALGAEYYGLKAGSVGHSASFSLHPRKAITAGEGGVITTNDSTFAEKCRLLRNHGYDPAKGKTGFEAAGFNYRITDFQAALAYSQFKRFDDIKQKKEAIAERYLEEISNSKVELPIIPKGCVHSWQSFHLLLNGISQTEAIAKLKQQDVEANYGAQCIPAVNFYRDKYKFESVREFPNAWNAFENGLVIPLYAQMNAEEVQRVIHSVNKL